MADKTEKAAPAVAPEAPNTEERLVAWVEANRKPVAIGAGVLVAIVLLTWFVSSAAQRKENFARMQLEQAWAAADAGNTPLAASELQRVVEAFGGTDAAQAARLSLNELRLTSGQSQLAVEDLTQFVASRPPARYLSQANMLLGAAQENLGDGSAAASAYEAAAASSGMDFLKAEALVAAARAYRAAGQEDKAIQALRTVLERYPETSAFAVAEVRLGELLRGT